MKMNISGEVLAILSWINEISFRNDLDDEEAFVYNHYLEMLGKKIEQYKTLLDYKE